MFHLDIDIDESMANHDMDDPPMMIRRLQRQSSSISGGSNSNEEDSNFSHTTTSSTDEGYDGSNSGEHAMTAMTTSSGVCDGPFEISQRKIATAPVTFGQLQMQQQQQNERQQQQQQIQQQQSKIGETKNGSITKSKVQKRIKHRREQTVAVSSFDGNGCPIKNGGLL